MPFGILSKLKYADSRNYDHNSYILSALPTIPIAMEYVETLAETALLHQDIRSITAKFIAKNYPPLTLPFIQNHMLTSSGSCSTWLTKLAQRYADNSVHSVSDRLSELAELAHQHGI